MTDIAIRANNLSKQYQIGRRIDHHATLRDQLADTLDRPVRWLRRNGHSLSSNPSPDLIWALKDVSLEIKRGEVVGIIGRNGAGKSTLLKILSRITEPTRGYADIFGRVGSLLEVGTGFHPELTGRENVYLNGAILGMKRAEIDRKFDEMVAFAGVEQFIDTPVKRYSSGMSVRLAFAVAAHLDPEILLVDEVLAVGDAAFQKKCLGRMGDVAKGGRTVLFVSHNMGAVSALCPRAVLLDGGRVMFDGSTAQALECYLGQSSGNKDNSLGNEYGPISLLGRDRRFTPTSARLNSVVLLDASEAPTKVFNFGDPLRLRLGFDVLVPSSQPVSVEIYLKSRLGESITYFPSSQFQNVSVSSTERGEQIMDLMIPSLPLARGSYAFDLSLAIPQMQLLDYVESACDFQVEVSDPGKTGFSFEQRFGVGSVCIEHYWEPRPAQAFSALEAEPNVR